MSDWRHSHWYRQAEGKPPGYRFRTWHEDCTTQHHMQVSVSREGVSAYCHKCKEKMFVPAAALSLAEKAALRATQEASDKVLERNKALPLPKTEDPSEWPLDARVWVYKAGISNDEIIRSGLYYHKPSNRVVIPIRDNGCLSGFWQARSPNAVPKYLNPAGFDRRYIVAAFARDSGCTSDCVVLVEDWLSAFRVHRATGRNVWALLGTAISDEIAARLCNTTDTVYVWLDNDRPGILAAAEIRRKLQAYGLEARCIKAEKDPKMYSDREIVEILNVP